MRSVVSLVVLLVVSVFAGCLNADDGTNEPPAVVWEGGFSDRPVPLGTYDASEAYALVLQKGPFAFGVEEAVYLTSDADGTTIEIGVVRPDVPAGEKVPVIVLASPYFLPLHASDLREVEPRLTENFVPHGFAVAFVAVRGTADSGGCSDLFGPLEKADLDQAITWLGTQEWSNANVGMIGVSYDGSTPWIVAATGNPYLKTIVPISGLSDVFNLEFRNGTTEQRMLGLVSALYWAYGFAYNTPLDGRDQMRVLEGILCPAAFQGVTSSLVSAQTGERDPFGYWDERNQRPGVEANYNGSILLVHGLQDWNVDPHHAYPWVNALEDQGITVKHLLGQWGHAWPDGDYLDDGVRRVDFAEKMLHWFDYWLRGNTTADLGPGAEVQDSSGRWRYEDTWPPRDATPMRYFLAPGAALTTDEPSATEEVVVGTDVSLVDGEPMPGAPCSLCAVFLSEPLGGNLRFAGLPRVHVTVIPSAPTGHLSAFLYAYYEGEDGGRWDRLGWTQMDIRFYAGGEEAQTVTPGEPIVMKMQLEPLDASVAPEARLALVLTEGTQHDRTPVSPFAPMRVVAGAGSVMTLDTFDRGEEVFFEVPVGEA